MIDSQIDKLIQTAKHLPWTDSEFYSRFMAQIYFLTTYSVKMLAAAAAVTERPDFYKHLITQIRLEIGHDKVALSDLKSLGHDPKQFNESGITRSIWESQLYKIQRNPDALIGYVYALEKSAVEVYGHILPTIAAKYGDKAVKFIRLHAEEDQEHVVEARKQIEALAPASRQDALVNANQACTMLNALFIEIAQEIKVSKSVKAA